MKQIIMFEKPYRGGVITALYNHKSKFPFSFMFSKGEKYRACLPCKSLAECWNWADIVRLDKND